MTLARELVRAVRGFSQKSLPEDVATAARLHFLDAIGVESDILYPLYQSQAIVEHARAAGVEARSVELDSPHGHDASDGDE